MGVKVVMAGDCGPKVYKITEHNIMSVESLRNIYGRVNGLQVYIERIPRGVGALDLKTKIDEACSMLPGGGYYDHIVQNLKRLLPLTIDLADLKLGEVETYCGKLCEPYRKHIADEVSGILLELQSFQSSHGWVTAGAVHQNGRMTEVVHMQTLLRRMQSLQAW